MSICIYICTVCVCWSTTSRRVELYLLFERGLDSTRNSDAKWIHSHRCHHTDGMSRQSQIQHHYRCSYRVINLTVWCFNLNFLINVETNLFIQFVCGLVHPQMLTNSQKHERGVTVWIHDTLVTTILPLFLSSVLNMKSIRLLEIR